MGFSHFSGGPAPRQGSASPLRGQAQGPSLKVRYSSRSSGSRILSACERGSSEPEPPGHVTEVTNPHVSQSTRRHMPRGARPRDARSSTAPPARPFPRRGVGREPCKQDPSATNGRTRATPSAKGGKHRNLAAACRSDRFHWKPALADPPTIDSPKRSTGALTGTEPDALEGAPTPNRFLPDGQGDLRTSRSAAVPWYRSPGGPTRLRRASTREAPRRDPRTPTCKPDCRN